MTDYIILTKTSASDLEKEVKEYLGKGWKLAGGVSVSMSVFVDSNDAVFNEYYFAQALYK